MSAQTVAVLGITLIVALVVGSTLVDLVTTLRRERRKKP